MPGRRSPQPDDSSRPRDVPKSYERGGGAAGLQFFNQLLAVNQYGLRRESECDTPKASSIIEDEVSTFVICWLWASRLKIGLASRPEASMVELRLSWMRRFFFTEGTVFVCWLGCLTISSAFAQDVPTPTSVFLQNQVVRIANLPSLTAQSSNPTAVLATSLETIIHDKDVCCGKDSGLEEAVLSASSLKDLSAKAQGRH